MRGNTELLTTRELAKRLQVSPETVRTPNARPNGHPGSPRERICNGEHLQAKTKASHP
jgi:hypothetical protein